VVVEMVRVLLLIMVEVDSEPPIFDERVFTEEVREFGTERLVSVALPLVIFAFPILVIPVPVVLMLVFPNIVFTAPIPVASIWFWELIPEAFKMLETPIPDTVKKFPPTSPDTMEVSPNPETFNKLSTFKFGKLSSKVEVDTPFISDVIIPLLMERLFELIIVVVPTEPPKFE
jgi:hypothetical protein